MISLPLVLSRHTLPQEWKVHCISPVFKSGDHAMAATIGRYLFSVQLTKFWSAWCIRNVIHFLNFFCLQLSLGLEGPHNEIKKVVTVAILGGSRGREYRWKQGFKRHYVLRDVNSSEGYEDGIECNMLYTVLSTNLDLC